MKESEDRHHGDLEDEFRPRKGVKLSVENRINIRKDKPFHGFDPQKFIQKAQESSHNKT